MHERHRRPQVGLGQLRGLDYAHQWCLRELPLVHRPPLGAQHRPGGAQKTGNRKTSSIIPVPFAFGQSGCCGATVVLRTYYVQYFVRNHDFLVCEIRPMSSVPVAAPLQ